MVTQAPTGQQDEEKKNELVTGRLNVKSENRDAVSANHLSKVQDNCTSSNQ